MRVIPVIEVREAIMRVTERMRWMTTQRELAQNASKADEATNQVLSGKRVSHASHDPAAHGAASRLQAHVQRHEGFERNASRMQGELERQDSALSHSHDILTSARELAVQLGDDTLSPEQLATAAGQVESLRDSLLSLANSKEGDRYLFGGTQGSTKPYDAVGNATSSTAPTPREVTVGEGMSVTPKTAPEVFGEGEQNVFTTLNAMADALRAGDTQAVRDNQAGLDAALKRIQSAQQHVGNELTKTDQAQAMAQSFKFADGEEIERLTGVDFAEAVGTMQQASTIYELGLKVAAENKNLVKSIFSL